VEFFRGKGIGMTASLESQPQNYSERGMSSSRGMLPQLSPREIGLLVLLLATVAVLYHHVVTNLVGQWWHDPEYSHGFFVPILAGWILWRERHKLLEILPAPSWWGVPIILCAMGLLIVGSFGAEIFVSRISLLILLAGLVIHFYGWNHFRPALAPWLVLFLMIPLPAILANQIVLPLQFVSSGLATGFMDLCNIPVYRQGNIIYLPSITLEVAEACSGIRSLMAMITLAVAYGYLLEQRAWKRVVLVLSAVPIAVLANGVRIMASGVLGQYLGRDKAEGFFHLFSGLVIFSFSFLLLWMLHSVLRRFSGAQQRESLA
jgi:exosortase